MEDLTDIRLSGESSNYADDISKEYHFSSKVNFLKFALAYSIVNLRDDIDFETLDKEYDSIGTNYHSATIDSDNWFIGIIKILYPDCTTPYRYIRVLLIKGILEINDILKSNPSKNISDFM